MYMYLLIDNYVESMYLYFDFFYINFESKWVLKIVWIIKNKFESLQQNT